MKKPLEISILFFLITIMELMGQNSLFSQQVPLPYELRPAREAMFLSIGIPLTVVPFYVKSTTKFLDQSEIEQLNADDVNIFDRWVIDNWSLPLRNTSRMLPYVSGGIGATTLFIVPAFTDQSRPYLSYVGTLSLMYIEGVLISQGLSFMMNTYINRPKPYVYNTKLPMEFRVFQGNNASFYSKRACFTFYNALFSTMVMYDMFPDKPVWLYVGAGLFGVAGLTVAAELSSGEHFYTDVLTGMAIGTATAYAIVKYHRVTNLNQRLTIIPAIGPKTAGIYLNYRFY
ncbi:MAG TPA: phosphatase PAP2 family protein [Bacteroidales bacterium]|nr:phosphatase PAP2 family protein [Bacteroidales bacterium]HQP04446.1 phosphatase PAP2 family protein [Bacteroidales bacterium]